MPRPHLKSEIVIQANTASLSKIALPLQVESAPPELDPAMEFGADHGWVVTANGIPGSFKGKCFVVFEELGKSYNVPRLFDFAKLRQYTYPPFARNYNPEIQYIIRSISNLQ